MLIATHSMQYQLEMTIPDGLRPDIQIILPVLQFVAYSAYCCWKSCIHYEVAKSRWAVAFCTFFPGTRILLAISEKNILSSLELEFIPLTCGKLQTPFFLLGFCFSIEDVCAKVQIDRFALQSGISHPEGSTSQPSCMASGLELGHSWLAWCAWQQNVCLPLLGHAVMCLLLPQVSTSWEHVFFSKEEATHSQLQPLYAFPGSLYLCSFPKASEACVPWDWGKKLQSLVISQSKIWFTEVALTTVLVWFSHSL